MFTGVNRDLDSWTSAVLHHEAYVGALEFRHQFLEPPLPALRLARPLARGRQRRRDRGDAARSGASLPASRRAARLRFDAHLARRRRRGDQVRQDRRDAHACSRPATCGARRDSRSTTSATCSRPTSRAGTTGSGSSSISRTAVYQRLRWNINWWQYWSAAGLADRARREHQHAHAVQQPLVAARRRDARAARHHLVRSLRARRPGGAAGSVPLAVDPIQGDDRHKHHPVAAMSTDFESSCGRNNSLSSTRKCTLNASTRFSATVGCQRTATNSDRQSVVSAVARRGRGARLHLRAPRPADAVAHGEPGLHLHADAVGPVAPAAVREPRDLLQLAGAGQPGRGRLRRPLPAVRRHQRHQSSSAASTRSSSIRTSWCAGSTGPGRRCSWCGPRGATDFQPVAGPNGLSGDFRNLFELRADNTFLVKFSYWFNR